MKVSIITVSYNSQNTIEATVKSVYSQTYQDIEYILVDGKSSDKTVALIKGYDRLFNNSNKRLRWISERDGGIYEAINKGIKMASGDIIGILSSNDYFYDDTVIADIVAQFNQENCDCLYGNIIYVNPATGNIARRWISRKYENGLFEKSWTPGHPTFYCKKELYNRFGLYRTDFKIAADVELMYRFLAKHKVKSYYFNRYLVIMRPGGISGRGLKSTIIITKEMKRAFRENGGNFQILKYLFYKGLKVREFFVRGQSRKKKLEI